MSKKISPNYTSTDWPADLADRNSPNWDKAIDIVRDRFEGRYLKPLEVLTDHEDKSVRTNVGFIVMSIDCLLIETLTQFYLGLVQTEDKYYYKNSDSNFKFNWQAFRDFFKHSNNFSAFKGDDDLCKQFFKQIRCGLLHQAESKFNSVINIKRKELVTKIDSTDVTKGLIINRKIFHEALCDDFKQYFENLIKPDSQNIFSESLRDNCNKKMIAICS